MAAVHAYESGEGSYVQVFHSLKPAALNHRVNIASVEIYLAALSKALYDGHDFDYDNFDELRTVFIDYGKMSKENMPYLMKLYEEGAFDLNIDKGSRLKGTVMLSKKTAFKLLNQVFLKGNAEKIHIFSMIDMLLNYKVITGFSNGTIENDAYVPYNELSDWIRAAVSYGRSTDVKHIIGSGFLGNVSGGVENTSFALPFGIAVNSEGKLIVKESNKHEYAGAGYADGHISKAQFSFPRRIIAVNGMLIIADTGNHAVRVIYKEEVYTIAGNGEAGDVTGRADAALFNKPMGICYSGSRLYICDAYNNKIKSIKLTTKTLR